MATLVNELAHNITGHARAVAPRQLRIGAGVVVAAQFLAHELAGAGHRQQLGHHAGGGHFVRGAWALQKVRQAGASGFVVGKGVELALVGCGGGFFCGLHLGGGGCSAALGIGLGRNARAALVGPSGM